jgi:hypothetical protein
MPQEIITEEQEQPGTHTDPLTTTVESTLVESEIISTQEGTENGEEQEADQPPPPPIKRFHPNWSNIFSCILLLILIGEHVVPLAWTSLDAFLHPKAIVTLFAAHQQQQYTYIFLAVTGTPDRSQNQIASRLVSFTTPTQQASIQTTGVAYTLAVQATGSLVFYNEANYPQTIEAGTVISATSGIQVVTDQTVTIAAGDPPQLGSASVVAHSLQLGTRGNIPPLTINTLCCLSGIYAKNLSSFSGGQDPQSYPTVSTADLQTATRQLAGTLDPQARKGVQSQIAETERPLTTIQCSFNTISQPKIGERATTATVSVSEMCQSQVYDYAIVQMQTDILFFQDAQRHTGSNFILSGIPTITINKVMLMDKSHNTYKVAVSATGIMIFHLSPAELKSLVTQIAGEKISIAQRQLLAIEGVQGVYIKPANPGEKLLPAATSQIQIVLQ